MESVLRGFHIGCNKCRDRAFSAVIPPLLMSVERNAGTLKSLHDLLEFLRVTSLACERNHFKISVKKDCVGGEFGALES